MKIKIAALAAILATATAMTAQGQNATFNHREFNQQERIGQGFRSGEMTRGEARHVERQERAFRHEERNMRASNGGHLTRSDRRMLDRQQNHMSHEISRDKHNARFR